MKNIRSDEFMIHFYMISSDSNAIMEFSISEFVVIFTEFTVDID